MPYFVKGLAPDIFTIPELLTPNECQALIGKGEALGFELATINTSAGHIKATEIRKR